MVKYTLIHTALLPEAKPIINYYKLVLDEEINQYKVYKNKNIILIVSGIGKVKTKSALRFVLDRFEIIKAINIGIAGCKDESIQIAEFFCTNKQLNNINHTTLTTVDEPLDDKNKLQTTLVDMEAEYFLEILDNRFEDIYVLKIVSDYLSKEIPKKGFVYDIINKSLKKWKNLI